MARAWAIPLGRGGASADDGDPQVVLDSGAAQEQERRPLVDQPQVERIALVKDRHQAHALALPCGDLRGDGLQIHGGLGVEQSTLARGIERALQYLAGTPDGLDLVGELGPGAVAAPQQCDEGGSLQVLVHGPSIGTAS